MKFVPEGGKKGGKQLQKIGVSLEMVAIFEELCGPREPAALRAISCFALYSAHNAWRYGRSCPEDSFRGFLREATRGHVAATALVARAFKRPRIS